MIKTKPGVPSLLRELNDSAVLRHIMEVGAVTRSELAAHTGLSRVTSSQALSRLQALGVVRMHGTRSGARGPAAELYELVPTIGTAVGIAVYADLIRVQLCGLDGVPVASLEAPLGDDVVSSVTEACRVVCEQVGESHGSLLAAALATPGVVDPASGELSFSYDLRDAETLRGTLSDAVGVPFVLGNDVHLAALAEQSEGVAKGEQDFVLLWIGRGLGMASVIGGKVRVGSSGAAGEIGYLPVPGVPLPSKVDNIQQGSFQRLVGMEAVLDLVRAEGDETLPARFSEAVVTELGRRLALGVAAISTIQDPGLIVLTGETVQRAGDELPQQVAEATSLVTPTHPRVEKSPLGVLGPVGGARLRAVEEARALVLARVTDQM